LSNAPDVDAMFADPTRRMRDLGPCMRAAGPEHNGEVSHLHADFVEGTLALPLIEVVAGR